MQFFFMTEATDLREISLRRLLTPPNLPVKSLTKRERKYVYLMLSNGLQYFSII